MPKTKHVVVVFKFAVNVPQFMQDAAALLSSITSPNAKKHIKITAKMVAQIKAHLKILSQKQTTVKSGGRGAVLLRDMAVTELQNDIRELVRLVQKKADETKDELEKIVVIKSCGMKIKKTGGRTRQMFNAENDLVHGGVILRATGAGKRDSHQWEHSLNKVNWIRLPSTVQATTRVMGLTAGAKYYFRHRLLTKEGERNWEITRALRVAGFDET